MQIYKNNPRVPNTNLNNLILYLQIHYSELYLYSFANYKIKYYKIGLAKHNNSLTESHVISSTPPRHTGKRHYPRIASNIALTYIHKNSYFNLLYLLLIYINDIVSQLQTVEYGFANTVFNPHLPFYLLATVYFLIPIICLCIRLHSQIALFANLQINHLQIVL